MDSRALDTTVATLWRVESPRVIARLVRLVGDVDTAEELAQDAFVTAIEKWRAQGIPNNPAAWLHKTARFLAVDRIRRRDTQRSKYEQIAATSPQTVEVDLDEVVDGDLADDLLGLILMVCHPILPPDARSALTLKLICGLSTEDVARAFLAPEPTIAQRIVRAKRTLAAANVRFELPDETERPARLAAVREVVYLVFNEGHTATSGDQWIRHDLCAEALRLGRMLASLTPRDAETLGLLALMELQASCLNARTGSDGQPVLLMDQDRARWDELLIRAGWRSSSASTSWAGRGLTHSRRRSPPATRKPGPPPTPTGSASPRSTTGSPRSAPRQWWSSTAPLLPRRHSGRRPDWPS